MMPRATGRVAFHKDMLRQLEDRERVLRAACDDTREAIRRSQAELAATETDLRDVQDRAAQLIASIENICSRDIASLPDELLRMIFAQCAAEVTDRYTWDDSDVCTDIPPDSAISYKLATVCRRWRCVATNAPELWSLLAVPTATTAEAWCTLLWHVETMLERSGLSAIDIVIIWPSLDLAVAPINDVLATIGRAARRWRRFSFEFPCQLTDPEFLDIFRRPSPMLESLAVVRSSEPFPRNNLVEHDIPAHYLPHCPKLRNLTVRGYDILRRQPRSPTPSLVKLVVLINHRTDDSLWQTLRLLPSLQYLDLSIDTPMGPRPDGSKACFPNLRYLACRIYAVEFFSQRAKHIELPLLRVLELDGAGREFDEFDDLLSLVGETVEVFRCIELDSELDDVSAACYAVLRNVRELELLDCSSIDGSFFEYMAENSVWPKLGSITILSAYWKPFNAPEDADAFATLVQSRTAPTSGADASDRPCRLQRVDLRQCVHMQEWLLEQIEFLLNPVP